MIILLTLNKLAVLQNLNRPKKLMVNLQTLNKQKKLMFILLTQKNLFIIFLLVFNQCSKSKSFSTVQRLFYDVQTFLRCRDFHWLLFYDAETFSAVYHVTFSTVYGVGDFRCKELLTGIELVPRQVSMIEALCFIRSATESQRPG